MAGATKSTPKVEPYNLDSKFERALVTLLSFRPKLFGEVGVHLDPDALASPVATLAVKAIQAIARDTGNGPPSGVVVCQRLRRWQDEGSVTHEDVCAVMDYFEEADIAGLPNITSMRDELAPILRERAESAAASKLVEARVNKQDKTVQEAAGEILQSLRIGTVDMSVGTALKGTTPYLAAVHTLQSLRYLPTGVPELDAELNGGHCRSELGFFLGGSGDGKSMALNHVGCTAALSGLNVAYATMELRWERQLMRMIANLTDIPTHALSEGVHAKVQEVLDVLSSRLGHVVVQEFPPETCTVDDLREWVHRIEDQSGVPVHVLVVDYADKMIAKLRGKDARHDQIMGSVYENLRYLAIEKNLWVWTASQTKGRESSSNSKKKGNGLGQVADSMGKVRVADLIIGLDLTEEGMTYRLLKNRNGKGRVSLGPIPTDFDVARLVQLDAEASRTRGDLFGVGYRDTMRAADAQLRLGGSPQQA